MSLSPHPQDATLLSSHSSFSKQSTAAYTSLTLRSTVEFNIAPYELLQFHPHPLQPAIVRHGMIPSSEPAPAVRKRKQKEKLLQEQNQGKSITDDQQSRGASDEQNRTQGNASTPAVANRTGDTENAAVVGDATKLPFVAPEPELMIYSPDMGLSGSYLCSSCGKLRYSYAFVCPACSEVRLCVICFEAFRAQQDAVVDEIRNEEGQKRLAEARKTACSLQGTATWGGTLTQAITTKTLGTFQYFDTEFGLLPPLMFASLSGNVDLAKEVLDKSEFSNDTDVEYVQEEGPHKGKTALILAAEHGHREIVLLLKSRGANCEVIDDRGMTPLMHAAFGGHVEALNELIVAGVAIDRAAFCGYTALLFAANRGHDICLKRLIQAKARLNVKTPSGRTPLIIACFNGHAAVVRLLLQHVAHHGQHHRSSVKRNLSSSGSLDRHSTEELQEGENDEEEETGVLKNNAQVLSSQQSQQQCSAPTELKPEREAKNEPQANATGILETTCEGKIGDDDAAITSAAALCNVHNNSGDAHEMRSTLTPQETNESTVSLKSTTSNTAAPLPAVENSDGITVLGTNGTTVVAGAGVKAAKGRRSRGGGKVRMVKDEDDISAMLVDPHARDHEGYSAKDAAMAEKHEAILRLLAPYI